MMKALFQIVCQRHMTFLSIQRALSKKINNVVMAGLLAIFAHAFTPASGAGENGMKLPEDLLQRHLPAYCIVPTPADGFCWLHSIGFGLGSHVSSLLDHIKSIMEKKDNDFIKSWSLYQQEVNIQTLKRQLKTKAWPDMDILAPLLAYALNKTVVIVNLEPKDLFQDQLFTYVHPNDVQVCFSNNLSKFRDVNLSTIVFMGLLTTQNHYVAIVEADKKPKCPICFSDFEDDLILSLPCFHYLCDCCVTAYENGSKPKKTYPCPICRIPTQSRARNIDIKTAQSFRYAPSVFQTVESGDNAFQRPCRYEHRGKGFTRSDHLESHQRTHDGGKPYKCEHCGKGFTRSGDLKSHQRTHDGGKPYKCEHCGKGFTRSGDLKSHQRTHDGGKPYKCEHCGKGFTRSGDLKSHQRTHDGGKPYKCEHCGKGFARSGDLKSHQRIHDGGKPYKCEHCGKGFTRSGYLESHQRIHDGGKPYKCERCGKGFTRSGHLALHQRTQHVDRP